MTDRIYLSPPHLGSDEKELVVQALDSNWVAPVGPHLDKWENEICRTVGSQACCLLNSATAAIHLALKVLDVGPGDLVFIQTHTHIGSVNPIIYQGAIPVFIDSEPGSWNMCPKHLEKAIQSALDGTITLPSVGVRGGHLSPSGRAVQRTGGDNVQPKTANYKPKAIIPVHLYGMPANMDAIMAIAKKYKLVVIEDAAESMGSTHRGKHTGTIGDIGVYSFNGNKIITSSGGGALVSDNHGLIKKARFLATQAREEALHFQHSEIGYNYRMSNILAALGRGQMKLLNSRVNARRANHEGYRKYFNALNQRGFNFQFQEEADESFSNRWLTTLVLEPEKNNGVSSADIIQRMEKNNIECRPLWKPMHLQPVFKGYPYVGNGLSEGLFNNGLCLPSGSSLKDTDFERIFNVLDQCFIKRS